MEFWLSNRARVIPAVQECAAHFAIAPDSCITSFPGAGIHAITIAREGRRISAPRNSQGTPYIGAAELLHRESREPTSESSSHPLSADEVVRYPVTDEVEEFCTTRRLPLSYVVIAGARLLYFAQHNNAGPGRNLYVNGPRKKKTLDSRLEFKITPLNTIAIERKKASVTEKLSYRFHSPRQQG